MNALDEVRECAVVSIETEGFEGTKICCAYVSERGSGDRARRLREALRSSLPQYMLPTEWLRLDALPKEQTAFRAWLFALIATNAISLVIDACDAARFAMGERLPYYVW